jgi:membrane-bound ClpP family serine protease
MELLFMPMAGAERFHRMDAWASEELKARAGARAASSRGRWSASGDKIGDDGSVDILAQRWNATAAENVQKNWNVTDTIHDTRA